MALKATIFKAQLQISDTNRHYYQTHALTIARHPSETDERMMVRILAFAGQAHEALLFGKGLSSDDEPDLWRKDLTGAIQEWIDVGLPDDKRLRRACGRAQSVVVYSYGGSGAHIWRKDMGDLLKRSRNLKIHAISQQASQSLALLADRNMTLSFTFQDKEIWVSNEKQTLCLEMDWDIKNDTP
jgi:uncharacterized protein YaeQ